MSSFPFRTLIGSSVNNARQAAGQIAVAVTDRANCELEPLRQEECWQLLEEQSIGRLAYIAREGTPDICPVNYCVHQGDLLVASGPGPKLQAAERRDVVAFEVDDLDAHTCTGRSVVVLGKARKLTEDEVATLGDLVPSPWATGPRRHVIWIRPTRVTGRGSSGVPGRGL